MKTPKSLFTTLNLKSKKEWAKFAKSKNKPKDIPSSAADRYTKEMEHGRAGEIG